MTSADVGTRTRFFRVGCWELLGSLALLAGCTGQVAGTDDGSPGSGGTPSGTAGASTTPGAGAPSGTGGTGVGGGSSGGAGISAGGAAGAPPQPRCMTAGIKAARAPLRRLTEFEFNNTVRDLLGDTTSPGAELPAGQLGNGFGNDAEQQSAAGSLVPAYFSVAEGIATRATQTPAALGKLAPCGATATSANEEACARTIIESLTPKAYRRPLATGEADELLAIYKAARPSSTFAIGVSTVLQAILQAPDFLYRPEFGVAEPSNAQVRRLTGDEMATRLSYLLWGTMPDETLRSAAKAGELSTKAGVLTHAQRMVSDPRGLAKGVAHYFFDNLLPLSGLNDLERSTELYPTFSPAIGGLLRQETHLFLEKEIFEADASWSALLTAPYTYVNGPLAAFYGMPAVQGDAFQKVNLDTSQRLGVLTQGSFAAGSSHSDHTNPVLRGSFVMQKLLCQAIPAPPSSIADDIKPPDPYSAPTARERYSAHSKEALCVTCHQYMDPVGLTLESFDAVGRFRTTENGAPIDPSGALPGHGPVSGAVELVQKIAAAPETHDCFSKHWGEFAYGVTFRTEDACVQEDVQLAFRKSGFKVKQLLLDLTQTDAFHYFPAR
ncbi:MAG TPA: DUF1592 domain-containing protein [Polyangiaceae bacterium]|nr:DUF1592 domain-containing protein [Polyangiaceae bacterium]